MHRFHVSPAAAAGPVVTLPDAESHHATRVLRLQPSDPVTVLDGAGQQLLCEVREITKRTVSLAVIERVSVPPLPYQLMLLQAIPKGRLMDDIVEKATELGAAHIVPLLTERTVPQVDGEAASAKLAKWQATAVEAIKQCGSAWLPRIETPVSLAQFLVRGEKFDLMLVASLHPGVRHVREVFQEHRAQHGRAPVRVAVCVGPEGDFTPGEVASLIAAGAEAMTLGPLVLRCETAAISALSVVGSELQACAPAGR